MRCKPSYGTLRRLDAVPALSAALFQPEPMTAVLDSRVFFNQMADFFETGVGKRSVRSLLFVDRPGV